MRWEAVRTYEGCTWKSSAWMDEVACDTSSSRRWEDNIKTNISEMWSWVLNLSDCDEFQWLDFVKTVMNTLTLWTRVVS
jgi:hypothetical protein